MTDHPPRKGRWYEKTFEVRASLEEVWRAITEGEELSRWFCESAQSEPGVGGYQTVDWGGGMVGTQDITAWEPLKYFRAEARPAEQGARGLEPVAGEPYATEWYLEHENGITRVRMVASGFGSGGAWDGEYDGTFHGWDLFHQNLKHYLENYPGKPAASVIVMVPLSGGAQAGWATLFGPEGLCAKGSIEGLSTGDRFDITAASGDRFMGTVRIANPTKRSFHAVVDSHDAVMNLECAEFGGAGFLWLNLLCWGRPKEETDALRERLNGLIGGLFPPPVMPAGVEESPG